MKHKRTGAMLSALCMTLCCAGQTAAALPAVHAETAQIQAAETAQVQTAETAQIQAAEPAADDGETVITGSAGTNITYTLDRTSGVLELSGTGPMTNCGYSTSDQLFYAYRDEITTVIIGAGITSVGDYAFNKLNNLKDVLIPVTVTEIGYGAFYQCTSLTSVHIPDGVVSIKSYAFESCSALDSFIMPDTVTSVGYDVFKNCSALTEVYLSEQLTALPSSGWFDGFFGGCTGLKNVTLPAGLESIDYYTFYNCVSLTAVTIPESVRAIGSSAFYGCASLTSVVIPERVQTIGDTAFYGCTNLSDVIFAGDDPQLGTSAFDNTAFLEAQAHSLHVILNGTIYYRYNGLDTVIQIPEGVTSIAGGAFRDMPQIREVMLPSTLLYIGQASFRNCAALTEAELPEGLREIGSYAFAECRSLRTVTAGNELETVGYSAFSDTPFLNQTQEGMKILGNVLVKYSGTSEKLVIPDSVTVIGDYAVSDNKTLNTVEFHSALKRIGRSAFNGTQGIRRFILPAGIAFIGPQALDTDSYPKIYGYAGTAAENYCLEYGFSFYDISSLGGRCGENAEWSLDMFTGTLRITGSGAVSEDSGSGHPEYYNYRELIRRIEIGYGITEIGSYAFESLYLTESVSLPDSLTLIGASAFRNCSRLSEIMLPDSLQEIGAFAFAEDPMLTEIYLPRSLALYGDAAFRSTGITAFRVSPDNAFFTVQDGVLYSKMKTQLVAFPPMKQAPQLRIPESVSAISAYAFCRASGLNTVIIPETVTSIGDHCFDSADGLSQIIFRGDAPVVGAYSLNTPGLTVWYDSAANGWSGFRSALTNRSQITWEDLAEFGDSEELTIRSERSALNVGAELKLTPFINPGLASDFRWESSAHVRVFADGTVLALKPGIATVTCESSDGKYHAEILLNITGTAFDPEDRLLQPLPKSAVSYTSAGAESMQIPCSELNGVYFLNGGKLSFYSPAADTLSEVMDFKGCAAAYTADHMLYVPNGSQCTVYDLLSRSVTQRITIPGYQIKAAGADAQGRIYLAANDSIVTNSYRIFLYTPDGAQLAVVPVPYTIYSFSGFDETNGNFYAESFGEWNSGSSSGSGRVLTCGRFYDDRLVFSGQIMPLTAPEPENRLAETITGILGKTQQARLVTSSSGSTHRRSSAMLGNYAAFVSAYMRGFLMFDSSQYPFSGTENPVTFAQDRKSLYALSDDKWSVGLRAAWNESRGTVLTYGENQSVLEFDPVTGANYAVYTASYPVFSLELLGDYLMLTERDPDGNYYLELISTALPEAAGIAADKTTLKAGESSAVTHGTLPYTLLHCWRSSDSSIASVTDGGIITGWRPGTAEIAFVPFGGNPIARFRVRIEKNGITSPPFLKTELAGSISDNVSDNNYTSNCTSVRSYLYEDADGRLVRVEQEDGQVRTEFYTASDQLDAVRIIEMPLPLFGGFFAGSDADYYVFGNSNNDYLADQTVVMIRKYSKQGDLLDELSLTGENTVRPFSDGALRMTEQDGLLLISTAHDWYKPYSDHSYSIGQSNMLLVVDEANMTFAATDYAPVTASPVSLSGVRNQFVASDGQAVYCCEHTSGSPNYVTLMKYPSALDIQSCRSKTVFSSNPDGSYDSSSLSVGGLALSTDSCLVVGNTGGMKNSDSSSEVYRNAFLSVTGKDLTVTSYRYLTDYTAADCVQVRTPQIVPLSENAFLILWEEYRAAEKSYSVRAMTVDGDGHTTQSPVILRGLRLSDCQPIMTADGIVCWYVTEKSAPTLCRLNPYDLFETSMGTAGDLNSDGAVNISDLVILRRAAINDLPEPLLSTDADINSDGKFDLKDILVLGRRLLTMPRPPYVKGGAVQ